MSDETTVEELSAEEKEALAQKERDKFTNDEVTGLLALLKGDDPDKPGWSNYEKIAKNPHMRRVTREGVEIMFGTKAECEEEVEEHGGEIVDATEEQRSRPVFGKLCVLKTGEVCELLDISKKKLENMRRAGENRIKSAPKLIEKWKKEGKDPSAFKLWIPSDSPRGQASTFDADKMFQEAGLDVDDF